MNDLLRRMQRHVNVCGICDHPEYRLVGPRIGQCIHCDGTLPDHLVHEAAVALADVQRVLQSISDDDGLYVSGRTLGAIRAQLEKLL